MPDAQDTLESVSGDLAEARGLLDAARKALRRLDDATDGDSATIRHAASRIERMASEVARIERVIAGGAVGAGRPIRVLPN